MNCELLIIINDGDSLLITGEIIREAIYCPIKGKLINTILFAPMLLIYLEGNYFLIGILSEYKFTSEETDSGPGVLLSQRSMENPRHLRMR